MKKYVYVFVIASMLTLLAAINFAADSFKSESA